MERQRVESDLWVPASIDEVWSFGATPQNLARISPAFFNIQIPADVRTANGAEFDITFKPLGIPVPFIWRARVSDVISEGPKRQFVDIQERGPFAMWRHQHLFESGAPEIQAERFPSTLKLHEAGTWLRERVDFSFRPGLLGAVSHTLFIKRAVAGMFAHRRRKIWERFGVIPLEGPASEET